MNYQLDKVAKNADGTYNVIQAQPYVPPTAV
jgi:hypothetical protein